MILFKNDWLKYPTAIVDTQTTNKSFLRIATVYREMGIKNHAFMLALINPDLQGIDPFDEGNLSDETKAAILVECKVNPWYFFREIARAPSKTGNTVFQFEANRGNMALYFLFFNHITVFLIQIRQTGKSFSVDTLQAMLLNITCTNTQINLLTKDDGLRNDNIRRIKDIDSEFPSYLRQRGKKDSNNFEGITVNSLGNSLKAHVPQSSPKAALKMGRGLTSPIFVIDESPFQQNIGVAMPAALAAGTAARELARLNDEPYGTILTTTAGKRDDPDGKYIFGLLQTSAEWSDHYLDCDSIEELIKIIKQASRSGEIRVNCTFNHIQLGKDDEWLYRSIAATMSSDVDAIDRDFFNKWTSGTQSSPLSTAALARISKSVMVPKYIQIFPNGYVLRWYIEEEEIKYRMSQGHYVLGSDTSDGSGGDSISIVIADMITGEVIAAATINEINLISFSQWLCQLFVMFLNMTGIIERRSSGVAVIDYLLLMMPALGLDPFKRLFNLAVNDHKEDEMRWREISVGLGRRPHDSYVVHKKTFGFATSGSGMASRTELYSTTLQMAAKKAGDVVRDKETVTQILGLITHNGRVDHAVGEHDDMVIAWLLCYWFMTKATNLSYYGIDSKVILSYTEDIAVLTPGQYQDMVYQQNVRTSIENIYNQMVRERDENVVKKLEYQLINLNRKLVLQDGEHFSIDDMINSLKEKRRNTRLNSNRGLSWN
jgi:hypothetical protein